MENIILMAGVAASLSFFIYEQPQIWASRLLGPYAWTSYRGGLSLSLLWCGLC